MRNYSSTSQRPKRASERSIELRIYTYVVQQHGQMLYEADRHVSIQEREPLEQELPYGSHSTLVASPVLEAKVGKVLEHFEALGSCDVPVALLLDLCSVFLYERRNEQKARAMSRRA